ncbi:MAG: ATP-binding protein [Albidovulum sp.]
MVALRPPFTLRQLLASLYLVGMLALTFGIIVSLQQRLNVYFYDDLLKNGRTIVQRAAEESRLPIIQGTVQHIRPNLETMAAYPDVTGLVIVTSQGKAVSALGSDPVTPGLETLIGATADHPLERPDSITVIAPIVERGPTAPDRDSDLFGGMIHQSTLSAAPRPTTAPNTLGYVALTLTKANMRADLRAIDRHVLAVMGAGALLVTLLALVALDRLTRPIKHLARIMADPETARHLRRVEVRGVREARVIATAYNDLIARVAASRADLARQVEDAVREVKRQNAELVVAREQAEAASRAKSRFVATVSHEIRTPLHGLMGALSLLDRTPLSDKQKSFLVMMREDADRLLREIDGILDFAKLEASGLELHERPCDLASLLARAVRAFETRARAKKLDLSLSLDPALPRWVRADGRQIEKIARILVDNAIKFTARGRVRVRAGGRPTREGAVALRLIVRDDGIGISPEQRASIFEPFAQADSSTTRQYGGTGLGLAICRQLVELMKGRVALKSRPGKGSTFLVELPLARSEPAPEPADEPEAPADALGRLVAPQDEPVSGRRPDKPFPRAGGRRVLVVDDERQSRLYAQFVLLELSADVVTAAGGAEALAACEEQRFDLILMDVRMPDMDGLETTRRLRRQRAGPNARTPVVGLTADALNLDRQDWREAGMDDCHHKPLDFDALAEIFARWGIGRPARKFALSAILGKYYER